MTYQTATASLNQANDLWNRSAKLWKPPPRLKVSEWAETHRRLSSEVSSFPGVWKTIPYQREIMDAICDFNIEQVVFLKSAQVGATEILNNICAYLMHQEPSPCLVIKPTLEMARDWSRNRLGNMLRDTPALQGLISASTRDADNTALMKRGNGFFIAINGANSSAGLASRSVRVVLADEISRYPPSAGDEGSPLALAIKRTQTWHNRKIYVCSTPTFKGCEIETRYNNGDQREYWVPCPECEAMQTLKWANVQWQKDQPDTAEYVCEHCGSFIPHLKKAWMLRHGEWRAKKPTEKIASFFINEIYSPWRTWSQMAATFLESKNDPYLLQTFINTSLGESFNPLLTNEFNWENLLQKREAFDLDSIPSAVKLLTCGVDCQKDRLEITTVGWADSFEAWAIDHKIIWGDPGQSVVWEELDEFLLETYATQDGRRLPITATCVDSGGHWTQSIYGYTRERGARRIWAIKGQSVSGKPIANRPSIVGRQRVALYPVGSDSCKEWVMGRLENGKPPAVIHFSHTLDEVYFEQLAGSEQKQEKFERGVKKIRWVQIRERNEALDCFCYALAAVYILNPHWSRLNTTTEPLETPEAPPKPERPNPLIRRPQRSRRTNWMNWQK